MNPLTEGVAKSNLVLSPEKSFSIGIRELLFLFVIFFFGFCGFSVCVNTIYTNQKMPEIESITVHDKDYTMLNSVKRPSYNGYVVN